MSSPENPAALSSLAMRSACATFAAIPNTALFATMNLLSGLPMAGGLACLSARDLEFVVDVLDPGHLLGLRGDRLLLFRAVHGASQRHHAARRDDLDVVGVGRQSLVRHHRLADGLRDGKVRLAVGLISGGRGGVLAVANVLAGV